MRAGSGRRAWVAFAGVCLLYVAGLVIGWPSRDQVDDNSWGLGGVVSALAFELSTLMFPLVGVLIASRRRGNAIGWLLLAIGAVWGLDSVCTTTSSYGLDLDRGFRDVATVAAAVDGMLWVPALGLTGVFLLLLFPDGHLLSRRWRWLAWLAGAAIALSSIAILFQPGPMTENSYPNVDNPLGIAAFGGFIGYVRSLIVVLPFAIAAAALSLVLRYKRSTGVERQQMKWLAASAATVAAIFGVVMAISLVDGEQQNVVPQWLRLLQLAALLSFGLIPISIGFAVLQYRLYDIDLILRRTLTYTCLAAVLAGVYLAGVASLSALLQLVIGQSNAVAVTGSTLVVIVVSRPLHQHLKHTIDRRFGRLAYDAPHTLEEFSHEIRRQVDLDALNAELLAAVATTLQPSHATLWLRPHRHSDRITNTG